MRDYSTLLLTIPDGKYTFLLVYQDYLKKFVVLSTLKTEKAEVASQLLDIFLLLQTPRVLQENSK
jgi:hypothetical protein